MSTVIVNPPLAQAETFLITSRTPVLEINHLTIAEMTDEVKAAKSVGDRGRDRYGAEVQEDAMTEIETTIESGKILIDTIETIREGPTTEGEVVTTQIDQSPIDTIIGEDHRLDQVLIQEIIGEMKNVMRKDTDERMFIQNHPPVQTVAKVIDTEVNKEARHITNIKNIEDENNQIIDENVNLFKNI